MMKWYILNGFLFIYEKWNERYKRGIKNHKSSKKFKEIFNFYVQPFRSEQPTDYSSCPGRGSGPSGLGSSMCCIISLNESG